MYKHEYLSRLRNALKGVDDGDADRLVDYYREMIEDGLENGGGEEFISSLEPPELVAQNYIRELGGEVHKENKTTNTQSVKVNNVGGNNSTPLIVKILLMAVCVVFAFAGAIAIGTLAIIAFSFLAYGFVVFILSFALLFSHTGVAFAQMGYAIILMAVGAGICSVMPFLGKAYAYLIKLLCLQKPEPLKFYGTKKLYIAWGATFAAGVFLFLFSFSAMGFSIERLAAIDDMVLKSQMIDSPSEELSLASDNLGLEIKYSNDGNIKLEYYDFAEEEKNFSYDNGNINLTSDYSTLGYWRRIIRRGVFFSSYSGKYNKGALYLPADFDFDLSIDIKNGAVAIEDMHFNDLSFTTKNGAIALDDVTARTVKLDTKNGAINIEDCTLIDLVVTTKNGAIRVDDVEASNSITTKTSNGATKISNAKAESLRGETSNGVVRFEDCSATSIYGQTSNGAVSVSRLKGDMIELYTNNGSVSGSIYGRKSDYKIEAHTSNGICNLASKTDGTKTLKVRTSNGSINLTFTE
ncbi:MAG: DUF4097 family beta strand repeat protein [Clostridiales bacterium]|nr:DUF4097 family beta strand repeat protein [Clostridiales bacterium]